MARDYGLTADYETLYGAYSKYLHPSAWTIVKPDHSWDPIFADVFLIHAQFYAAELAGLAADHLALALAPLPGS